MTVQTCHSKAKSLLTGSLDFSVDFPDDGEDSCEEELEGKSDKLLAKPLYKVNIRRPLDYAAPLDVVVSGSKKYNELFSSSRTNFSKMPFSSSEHLNNKNKVGSHTSYLDQGASNTISKKSDDKRNSHPAPSSRSPLKSILRVVKSKRTHETKKCVNKNLSNVITFTDKINLTLLEKENPSCGAFDKSQCKRFGRKIKMQTVAPLSNLENIGQCFRQDTDKEMCDYKDEDFMQRPQLGRKLVKTSKVLAKPQNPSSSKNNSKSSKKNRKTSVDPFHRHQPHDITRMLESRMKRCTIGGSKKQKYRHQQSVIVPDYASYVNKSVQKFKRNILKIRT